MAAELDNAKRTIVLRKRPLNINTELNYDIFLFNYILENSYNSKTCGILNFRLDFQCWELYFTKMASEIDNTKRTLVLRKVPLDINTELNYYFFSLIIHHTGTQ